MARQGMMPADHPRLDEHAEQEQPVVVVVVVPGRRDRDRDRDDGARRQLFLDAGRMLMLWGWAALLAAVSAAAGKRNNDRPGYSSAAVHAFLGLLLWLVGVSLVVVALVPPAARAFPRAARLGAAVANAVVHCFLAPWN